MSVLMQSILHYSDSIDPTGIIIDFVILTRTIIEKNFNVVVQTRVTLKEHDDRMARPESILLHNRSFAYKNNLQRPDEVIPSEAIHREYKIPSSQSFRITQILT